MLESKSQLVCQSTPLITAVTARQVREVRSSRRSARGRWAGGLSISLAAIRELLQGPGQQRQRTSTTCWMQIPANPKPSTVGRRAPTLCSSPTLLSCCWLLPGRSTMFPFGLCLQAINHWLAGGTLT